VTAQDLAPPLDDDEEIYSNFYSTFLKLIINCDIFLKKKDFYKDFKLIGAELRN
jgi:hypothetical protein